MYPTNLSPKAVEIVKLYDEIRWPGAKPRPCYQNLPDSVRLSYELLSWDNYETMLDLFGNDTNPFVMPNLREKAQYDQYAAFQLATGRYSGKHGACDWFLKLKNGVYVGVLHLYDVSFELIDGKRYPCSCGYAIAEPFRCQGYAEEALRHLLSQLPTSFKLYQVEAEPLRENAASVALLKKVGFRFEKYFKNEWGNSVLMSKKLATRIPKLTWEEINT
jgi:RimJ/RimL family protein N-acetyltransferase